MTDPNIKSLAGVTIESTSDSTPTLSECNPNLPPTGLSRSKSPRSSRTSKSPSSDQIFTDNHDLSNKTNRPTYQQLRSKFGSITSSNSLLASVSPSPSPFSLSVFRQAENQGKLSKDACTAEASRNSSDRGTSKLRLSSTSSCQNQDQEASKSSQSPLTAPKSPFSKMKSLKDGISSPESGRNKFLFYPNNATASSKKQLARLRKVIRILVHSRWFIFFVGLVCIERCRCPEKVKCCRLVHSPSFMIIVHSRVHRCLCFVFIHFHSPLQFSQLKSSNGITKITINILMFPNKAC